MFKICRARALLTMGARGTASDEKQRDPFYASAVASKLVNSSALEPTTCVYLSNPLPQLPSWIQGHVSRCEGAFALQHTCSRTPELRTGEIGR